MLPQAFPCLRVNRKKTPITKSPLRSREFHSGAADVFRLICAIKILNGPLGQTKSYFIGNQLYHKLPQVSPKSALRAASSWGSVPALSRGELVRRYDPVRGSYHDDMDGPGVFLLGVDILPTELAREATKHFGDALFPFVAALAAADSLDAAPEPMRRACIASEGRLTPLFEYITRMRETLAEAAPQGQLAATDEDGRFFTVVRHLRGKRAPLSTAFGWSKMS